MAIVNALRFDAHSGAMIVDEESWHLRRRKTYFTANLFELLPDPGGGPVCAAFGGAGDPNYHLEVALRARRGLADSAPSTVEEAGRIVLSAMHAVSRRITDDRLRMLFGFTTADLNRGHFLDGEEKYEIENTGILKRAREIVEGKERLAGRDLSPPNQACLIGTDPEGGFQMFCLKESDGVLSFNAGGFESLGPGRYAGGMRLTGALGERTLNDRREGFARDEGMRVLLESILDAADHFGMVGGRFHIVTLDDRRPASSRLGRLAPDRAYLATEAVKGYRGGFLGDAETRSLLEEIVFREGNLGKAEARLFGKATDPDRLELYLRGYKISQGEVGRGDVGS